MNDVTLTDKEFLGLKISNWESIPYSVSLKCPNECSTTFPYKSTDVESKIIGWCETPNGYMFVYECPVCFKKFRCHNTTTARNFLDKFKEDFELGYYLQNYDKA